MRRLLKVGTLVAAVFISAEARSEAVADLPLSVLQKRAEAADRIAETELGSRYSSGQGVQKNAETAVCWFHRAAMHGSAIAGDWLGMEYATGDGVEKDYVEAYSWFYQTVTWTAPNASPEITQYFTKDLADVSSMMTNQQIDEGKQRALKAHEEWEKEISHARGPDFIPFADFKPVC